MRPFYPHFISMLNRVLPVAKILARKDTDTVRVTAEIRNTYKRLLHFHLWCQISLDQPGIPKTKM
ncbi:MAG: hypothetical protein CMO55_16940 [Verrucomicrobiales bacterium]|nr:hypothetical protein [Verrucomicrobiales bacterium]